MVEWRWIDEDIFMLGAYFFSPLSLSLPFSSAFFCVESLRIQFRFLWFNFDAFQCFYIERKSHHKRFYETAGPQLWNAWMQNENYAIHSLSMENIIRKYLCIVCPRGADASNSMVWFGISLFFFFFFFCKSIRWIFLFRKLLLFFALSVLSWAFFHFNKLKRKKQKRILSEYQTKLYPATVCL